jgi:Protein of unknown function (DUF2844)
VKEYSEKPMTSDNCALWWRLHHPKEETPAMNKTRYALFLCVCIVAVVFAAAERVQAALGGSVDSIESDRKVLSAARTASTVSSVYSIHEIVSDATTVREYVSPDGIVFGFAWNGLVYPDLTQLLGPYADEYQKAMRQTPRQPGRRHSRIKTDRVIVEKWGQMRNLQGRAYAPALIPQGVSVDEIK